MVVSPHPTDYKVTSVRSAAVLTTSYVAGTVAAETRVFDQTVILIKVTLGSLDSVEMKAEFSLDNSTFYQEGFIQNDFTNARSNVKIHEYRFTTDDNYRIAIPITDNFVRISVKGTGTVTNSSVTVDLVTGRS